MKISPQRVDQLTELFMLSMEGMITEEQHLALTKVLKEDANARDYYYDFITLYVNANELGFLSEFDDIKEDWPGQQMWTELLKEEKTAPALEVPKKQKELDLPQKIVSQKPRKISKFNFYSALTSAAAILLIVIFLRFTPDKSSVEIASLADSIKVQWAAPSVVLENGDPIYSNDLLSLSKGFVSIQTERGVSLTIEAPAEFEFTKDADLSLNYGRVYAKVTPQGIGFSISTANTKVIDLGTEFAVKADIDGEAEVHVIKGKTTLVAGTSWLAKKSQTLLKGQAGRIVADGTDIKDIPIQEQAFVRSIHSETKSIWRGQKHVDLADIVGGGDGFGTGRLNTGIDPVTGKFRKKIQSLNRKGTTQSVSVPESPFVDVVFIPGQSQQDFPISSNGLIYRGFKNANGKTWCEICNGVKNFKMGSQFAEKLTLNGLDYGTGQRSMIMIHANAGITFDLDMVRNALPDLDITEFKTVLGIPDINAKPDNMHTLFDVYILLDGQEYFRREKMKAVDKSIPISIPISREHRFLTLALTDGGNDNHVDYALLAEPVLVLGNME